MQEYKYLIYGLVGFNGSQILGILFSGYLITQALILYLILGFLALIPGFLYLGGRQANSMYALNKAQIFSCFIPSLIAITILTIGFSIGYLVGL